MNKKKILILGSTGFIGTNLVNYFCFQGKYDVYGQIHESFPKIIEYNSENNPSYHQADLTKREEVESIFSEIKPEVVILAAAVTTGSKDVLNAPWIHVTDNSALNSLVFEACHRYKVKNCIFFSCSVMTDQTKDSPQKESDWDSGAEIYPCYYGVGHMKVYSERLCEFYSRLNVCKYSVIRLSNVIGPFDKRDLAKSHMVPAFIIKCLKAEKSVEVLGKGLAKRDIIYIDDVVNLVSKVIEKQTTPFERINCGVGKVYSVVDVIEAIKNVLDKPDLKIIYKDSPEIPTSVSLNTKKAKELFDWEPLVSFKTAIRETVEWYKLNA